MKKPIAVFLIFILFISCICKIPLLTYAHDSEREHNAELEKVLFESGYSKYKPNGVQEKIEMIESAAALTIDQFGGSKESSYNDLHKKVILGFPISFSSIDYAYEINSSEKKISPNTHRRYTHQGWNVEFGDSEANKFWKKRKTMLLSTLNHVFDFGILSTPVKYDSKCDALAGLIYYVHLLGDYDEADNIKKLALVIPLAGHSTTDQQDMITQLRIHLETLFIDQKTSAEYKDLMKELDSLDKKASKLSRSTGGIDTDEKFLEYHQYATDLLNILIDHVPKLLKEEKFFSEVFYQ